MKESELEELERAGRAVADLVAKDRNRGIAIHEAGHAVIATHLELNLDRVVLRQRDVSDGWIEATTYLVSGAHSPQDLEYAKKLVMFYLAGAEARKIIEGVENDPRVERDQALIRQAQREYPQIGDERIAELTATVRSILTDRREDVKRVAETFMEKTCLNREGSGRHL